MTSGTPPTNTNTSSGTSNGDAPTEPLHGSTASLSPGQQQRIPRWQGRPQGQQPASPPGGQQGNQQGGQPGSQQPGAPAPTFRGQQSGETAIFVRRKHPVVLILGGLPALLFGLGLLGVLLWRGHITDARLSALLFIVATILGILTIGFALKWLTVDLIGWFFNIYTLTDRRLVDAEGFIFTRRQEAPLDRIQQVQIDRNNIFEYFLDFGNVVIATAGGQGPLTFDAVAHPDAVADQIRETEQRFRSGGRGPAQIIEPKHPAVKKVLDEVAKPIVVTPPPGAPLRTFGGFLRRPAKIQLLDGEVVTDYIFRHWFVLVRREVIPAAIVIGSLLAAEALAAFFHTTLWVVALVGVLGGLVYGILVYLNYADDVFILTTHRIIDIDRFLFIFFEGRKQADYTRVQDVRVAVDTIIARILGFGNITVETAGRLPNIDMSQIPNPFSVQDKIFSRINEGKQRDAIAASNRQRAEDRRLIAATMNELLIEVPDVRQLFLLDAAERLRQSGLKLVVESERRALGVPPGVVMTQVPGAGTTALRDSEVQVVLSGR